LRSRLTVQIILKISIVVALLTSLTPTIVIGDPYPPLEHHTFRYDGIVREYFVHVPAGHSDKLPVVFAIHGYTSTATGFAVFHDLREHANENGYIVVYPQSSHFVDTSADGPYRVTSWNMLGDVAPDPEAGAQCVADADRYPCPPECGTCDRCGWASCNDDLGYFEKMLDEISSNYKTDRRRYYALGMSNGGMMTLRLGCSMSDRFAAIAPIDAQLPAGFDCEPSTRLPMIHLSGGKDNIVRPDGMPSGDGFVYVSAADTASTWAHALQCESGPIEWNTPSSNRAGLTCTAYNACAIDGQEVVSCVDPDETHNWPGKRPGGAWPTCVTSQQKETMPEQRLCEPRVEHGPHLGMDLVWEFFSRFEQQSMVRPLKWGQKWGQTAIN
jgi:polyhydroxybutyrate depolymerase